MPHRLESIFAFRFGCADSSAIRKCKLAISAKSMESIGLASLPSYKFFSILDRLVDDEAIDHLYDDYGRYMGFAVLREFFRKEVDLVEPPPEHGFARYLLHPAQPKLLSPDGAVLGFSESEPSRITGNPRALLLLATFFEQSWASLDAIRLLSEFNIHLTRSFSDVKRELAPYAAINSFSVYERSSVECAKALALWRWESDNQRPGRLQNIPMQLDGLLSGEKFKIVKIVESKHELAASERISYNAWKTALANENWSRVFEFSMALECERLQRIAPRFFETPDYQWPVRQIDD